MFSKNVGLLGERQLISFPPSEIRNNATKWPKYQKITIMTFQQYHSLSIL